MAIDEPVSIALLAKAPIPGFAKTRLIPVLGAAMAAGLQARLIERAAATARRAAVGPVTLWATPDESHPLFQSVAQRDGMAVRRQCEGDLGARMLEAMIAAAGPAIVMGTDCPALSAGHLRQAADILASGTDAVLFPAEDGGYVAIGMRKPEPAVFNNLSWSMPHVLAETRSRLKGLAMTWVEPATLWDVDLPGDLERLRQIGLSELIENHLQRDDAVDRHDK
jgi:rSAM/selenodomain-associated transferase 1